MIIHVFNASVVSGPEMLVLPALVNYSRPLKVVFLTELRRGESGLAPLEYARRLGLVVEEVVVKSRFDSSAIQDLVDLFDKNIPQIVHAHDVKASTYTFLAVKKMKAARPRLVSTHHGVRARFGWKIKLFESFYVHVILPHYDTALAVCSGDKKLLEKRGLKNVELHLNGIQRPLVDQDVREELQTKIRKAWGLQDTLLSEDVVLGFVGRLACEKRLDRIFRVLSYLKQRQDLPNWKFIIFGKGALEFKLKKMVTDLGLTQNVIWMGYRQNVGSEVAGFDVLLSMSDAEGLPINILEAGWAATPVFCTAVDGILDVINWDEKLALVSLSDAEEKMADKLAMFIKDKQSRISFATKFQEQVKIAFSESVWLKRLDEIYKNLSNIE